MIGTTRFLAEVLHRVSFLVIVEHGENCGVLGRELWRLWWHEGHLLRGQLPRPLLRHLSQDLVGIALDGVVVLDYFNLQAMEREKKEIYCKNHPGSLLSG